MPSIKTITCVCNRFSTSFCARNHKTNQAIWNLNRKFWNKSTQKIKSTTSLTDLFLKSLYKSIYANSYFALFVIIVTGCDVLSNEISFLTKRWWYCESKLFKSEKWCHLSKHDFPWQEPNPRSSKLLLLSSWLQFCVVTTCYTLLHQATRSEGKNSSRKHKDVLALIVILSNFSLSYLSFSLWCAILLQVMLYSA